MKFTSVANGEPGKLHGANISGISIVTVLIKITRTIYSEFQLHDTYQLSQER